MKQFKKKMFLYACILLYVIVVAVITQRSTAQLKKDVPMSEGLPSENKTMRFELKVWKEIRGDPHPMFGAAICALGDVNGDGWDDIAVSTYTDTTFILFGGPAFDGQPKTFVLGGGQAIVAGDFNGDAFTDIATAEYNLGFNLDSLYRGRVRIYLHNKAASMYDAEPNITFIGREPAADIGSYLAVGDVNGDKKTDLFIPDNEIEYGIHKGKVFLYLGKSQLDTIPDHVFIDRRVAPPDWGRGIYGYTMSVADINGDRLDDIIIKGVEGKGGDGIFNYEFYYGNAQANFDMPLFDIYGREYPFAEWWVFAADIQNDKMYDLFFQKDFHPPLDLSLIWGRDAPLPTVLPDTIFPNPNKSIIDQCYYVQQVGDLNGDGIEDYFIIWHVPLVGGNSLYLYRGGYPWNKNEMAYFGVIPRADFTFGQPYPLKDIDGDGVDDIAIRIGTPSQWKIYGAQGIKIYRGDRRMTPVENISTPESISLSIYPNPSTSRAVIHYSLKESSSITLQLLNVEGKVIQTLESGYRERGKHTIQFQTGNLASGNYFIFMTTEKDSKRELITIIK